MNLVSRLKNKGLSTPVVVVLLILIGFSLYANSFSNAMFWDDDDFILNNRYIKDWKYFPRYFTENLIAGSQLTSNYWRPAVLFVFAGEWHLWGDWGPGYHFVSTSLHVANSILLFFILLLLFNSCWLAFLTSLTFLVHPVQTEAVVYVNAISDSLSVLFMFLGMLFYIRRRSPVFLSLFYMLALVSKESAILFPGFLLIIEWFVLQPSQPIREKITKFLKRIWPLIIITAVYVLLRATVLNFSDTFNFYTEENIFASSFYVRFLTFLKVLSIYAGLLFFPHDLHVERTVAVETSLLSVPVITGALLLLGLFILAFTHRKKDPLIPFGIGWFLVGLVLTSNILVPINAILYEHFLYLPLIGIYLIVIGKALVWSQKYNAQKVFLCAFSGVLVMFFVIAFQRNLEWRNPIAFYEQTLRHAPRSYRVINNLGMEYADAGMHEKAKEMYERAIALDPSNPVGYHNLANYYRDSGDPVSAFENYKNALKNDPAFLFSYPSLAQLYLEDNEFKKARRVMEEYLSYTEEKLPTLNVLVKIALEEKDYRGALSYLRAAQRLSPQNQTIAKAIQTIEQDLNISP